MDEEVTTTSWSSRLKDSVADILIGIVLIAGAIVLVF